MILFDDISNKYQHPRGHLVLLSRTLVTSDIVTGNSGDTKS